MRCACFKIKNIKKMQREELHGISTIQDKSREDEISFHPDVSSHMSFSKSCTINEQDAVCLFCNGK